MRCRREQLFALAVRERGHERLRATGLHDKPRMVDAMTIIALADMARQDAQAGRCEMARESLYAARRRLRARVLNG